MSPANVSSSNVTLRMPIVSPRNEFVTGTVGDNVTLLWVAAVAFRAHVRTVVAGAQRKSEMAFRVKPES